jgi:hypothetical protein
MGTRDILPNDLLKELLDSGVKFDENGEIIDDLEGRVNDTAGQGDDLDEEDADESGENDSDEAGDEEDTSDSDEDTDEDADTKQKVTKLARKINLKSELSDEDESDTGNVKLTPKPKIQENLDESSEIFLLRRQIAELRDLISNKDTQNSKADQEEDIGSALREEAAKFRQMRLKQFAHNIETSVNAKYPDVSFKEIIASSEWEEYQNSRVMGRRVGDLYAIIVESEEADDVISFFDDFVGKFLPSKSKSKPIAQAMRKVVKQENKPALKDLAVPDNAKAAVTKTARSGFDFVASDYGRQLNLAERGKISRDEFDKFETKFFRAEKEGRVKNE